MKHSYFSHSIFVLVVLIYSFDLFAIKITVLTDPIGSIEYTGHPAVIRSLLSGLKGNNIEFNFNPDSIKDIYEVVHVIGNPDAIAQAIQLKKRGLIKFLLIGPGIVIRPTQDLDLHTDPAIDLILIASEWVKKCFKDIDSCFNYDARLQCWPSGIDEQFWKRSSINKESRKVLIYWKTESPDFISQIEKLLKYYGWEPVILRYGSYDLNLYKQVLEEVRFAVFVSASESQGLALAEAWSMDIPTLVWNPEGSIYYLGHVYQPTSSCPYLTKQTGNYWKTLDELDNILQTLELILNSFNPREFILNNMTDKVSVNLLINKILSNGGE